MSAIILDGKATAATIKAELAEKVKTMSNKPGLGTVLVGDDPGSHSYVGGKHKDCAEVGIQSIRIDLPGTATQADVLAAIPTAVPSGGIAALETVSGGGTPNEIGVVG